MTPEQERALLDATAKGLDGELQDAYAALVERIRAGEAPREAVDAILLQFSGEYADVMKNAFTAVLAASVGSPLDVPIEIDALRLSQQLYQQAGVVSDVVAGIVNRHQQGFVDAKALALELFEGYGFRPPDAEPLQINPRNPVLPQTIRDLLADPDMGDELQRILVRAEAEKLKTPALRQAYLDLIDELQWGDGFDALEKKLRVAWYEKVRYYANRIAQTETHRAYMQREAKLLLDDADVEFVQIRRSKGPKSHDACICDLFAGRDKYGLGPGVYPKRLAPMPPFHPYCRCVASPRLDIPLGKKWEEKAGADAYFLDRAGLSLAGKIMGSKAKAEAVAQGARAEDAYGVNSPSMYQVRPLGSVG